MGKFVSLFLILILLSSSLGFAAAATSSTTSIYFNGRRIETINSTGGRLYYHQDYLGSTRILTDRNGNQLARIDYEPFGRELADSTKTRYKFTGKEEDASSLQYFGARYYDSDTGRFTQIDPRYDAGESPYAYAVDNPLRYTDPDGKEPQDVFGTIKPTRLSPNKLLGKARKVGHVYPTDASRSHYAVYTGTQQVLLPNGAPMIIPADPKMLDSGTGRLIAQGLKEAKATEDAWKVAKKSSPQYGRSPRSVRSAPGSWASIYAENWQPGPMSGETWRKILTIAREAGINPKDIFEKGAATTRLGPFLGIAGITLATASVSEAAQQGGVPAATDEAARQGEILMGSIIGGALGTPFGPWGTFGGACVGGMCGNAYHDAMNSMFTPSAPSSPPEWNGGFSTAEPDEIRR